VKSNTTKIIVIFVLVVAAFASYTKWDSISNYFSGILGSGNTKIFKVAGNDIGPYVNGDNVMAEKDTYTKGNPKVGDIVVYQKIVDGKTIETMGTIVGLPGNTVNGKTAPSAYYIIEKNDQIEIVIKEKIIWRVTRKVL